MQETMKMAGAVTSHALWSVSDGAILSPLLGFLEADRSHRMERVMTGSAQAVAYGSAKLDALPSGTLGAVFVKDGVVTLPSGRTDTLIVDVRFAGEVSKRLQILVPYRNARHPHGFAIHRLKLSDKDGVSDDLVAGLFDAFVTGLASHEQGARLWKEKYVDQAGEGSVSLGEENTDLTAEEFALLKRSLFHVLLYVGRADGKVDTKEVAALDAILKDPDRFGSALLTRIATNAIEEFAGWFSVACLANAAIHLEDLAAVRDIVDRKLAAEDARKFKRTLVEIGREIANSFGGGLFSRAKVSREEQEVLDSIASVLGIAGD